jgi:phage gpG-like protein
MTSPFSIELNAESRRLMKVLGDHAGGLTLKNSMNLIGRQYRKEVDLIFARKQVRQPNLKWQELSPNTLKEKRRKGFGNKGILERTGNLRKSMTSRNHPNNITSVGKDFGVFGSSVKYGNYHDNTTSARSKMPLRNFSIPSVSTYGVFLRTIDEDIKAQLKYIGVSIAR